GEFYAAESPEPHESRAVEQGSGCVKQKRRNDCEGYLRDERRNRTGQNEHEKRGKNGREGRLRSGFIIRHRAIERATRKIRAEKASDHVRSALADKLAVHVDPLT